MTRVGIALPVRNAHPYIETCLTSINAQTWPCAAYVVDDASNDGTTEFLTQRPGWTRRYQRNPEQLGWPASLNLAANLALADGCDALFVANADDWLRLDCIERCVRALARYDWVVPYTQQIGGENVVQASTHEPSIDAFRDHCAMVAFALVRADVWQNVGGYHLDVNVPGLAAGYNEWDFYLRLIKAGYRGGVVTEPVVYYRMHDAQLHRATTGADQQARELLGRKHPDVFASPEEPPQQEGNQQ